MRDLRRNRRKLWYATYKNKIEETDENGDYTGEFTAGYSEPVVFYASLSAGKGDVENSPFGVDVDFTRTISTVNLKLPITETSLIWHETEPKLLADGMVDKESADYTIAAKPAKSLNQLVIAIKARAKNG